MMDYPYIFIRRGRDWEYACDVDLKTGSEATREENRNRRRVSQALLQRFGEAVSRQISEYEASTDRRKLPALYASALAGELLISPQHVPYVEQVLPKGWEYLPLFCGANADYSYDAFQDCTVAAALFPCLHKDGPVVGRIWAVRGTKDSSRLPDSNLSRLENSSPIHQEAQNRNIRLYVDINEDCEGESWQLSAWLAMSAVTDRGSDTNTRIRLASEWIATGRVSPDGLVCPVKIGDKPNVGLGRKWLISEADKESFLSQDDGKERKPLPVGNVQTAFAHVAGFDIRPDTPRRFELVRGEYHCIIDLLKVDEQELSDLLERKRLIMRRVCKGTDIFVWVECDEAASHITPPKAQVVKKWCMDHRFRLGSIPHGNILGITKRLREPVQDFSSQHISGEVWIDTTDSSWYAGKAVDSFVRERDSSRIVHLSEDGRWMSFRYEAGHPYVGDLLDPR